MYAEGSVAYLREVFQSWGEALPIEDREQIRCHISRRGNLASVEQLMTSHSFGEVLAWLEAGWLMHLIEGEGLVTFFQPIVRLGGLSTVMAYECLMRGRGENGDVIPPLPMLRAARAMGCLEALDIKAQQCALRTAAAAGLTTSIFINCLPQNLARGNSLVRTTLETAKEYAIDPARLVFEIVETDKIDDCQALAEIVKECRDERSSIALDDVGTGYNSLHLMTELRPDYIKLDRDLVCGVDHDLFKSRVASKLIELARELRIATVVEGIETEAEWQWAIDQGAEFGQGYFVGRPSPKPECAFASPVAALPILSTMAIPVSSMVNSGE